MAPNLEFVAKLDAQPAKREMRDLQREGSRVGQALSQGVRRAVGQGIQATGVGALAPGNLLSTGITSIRQNGLQDIVNESTQYAGNVLSEFVTGDMDNESRAAQRARADTMDVFQHQVAQTGSVPQAAVDYYNQKYSTELSLDKARERISMDTRFQGPGLTDLGKEIFSSISGAIEAGFNRLSQALTNRRG